MTDKTENGREAGENGNSVFRIYVGRDPREGVGGRYTFQGEPGISKFVGSRSLGCSKHDYENFMGPDSKDAGYELGQEMRRHGFDRYEIINGKLWLGRLEKEGWVSGQRFLPAYLKDSEQRVDYQDNGPFTLTDVDPVEGKQAVGGDHDIWRIKEGLSEVGFIVPGGERK